MNLRATAVAHPNIAFIKYWGLKDEALRLPANNSLSMNIGCLTTRTTVESDPYLKADTLTLNGKKVSGKGLTRVQNFMDRIRRMTDQSRHAHITSENNFPIGVGIASSASAFAALALAGTAALGVRLSESHLSSLARLGSGSACRSIPGGFVEWHTDLNSSESYAFSIAPPHHWDLADLIVIFSKQHKPVGSEAGMRRAFTSPIQDARIQDAERRMNLCRTAILNRDFESFSHVVELDSNLMHAVMMTSDPPLFYWQPASLAIIKAVKDWQEEGLQVTYTLDAGPNVHILCPQKVSAQVLTRLRQFPDVIEVLQGNPAGPARLITEDSPDASGEV